MTMPPLAPTKTDAPVRAPEQTPSPEKFYQPERLCPSQRKDGTRWSMP